MGSKQELLDVVKKSLAETGDITAEIGTELMECANHLRVEQTEELFNSLSEAFDNLSYLMDYIRELRNGLKHLDVSQEPLSCWDKSLVVLRDMASAFERKDWIMLADLIQYEFCPILEEGGKGLHTLKETLGA